MASFFRRTVSIGAGALLFCRINHFEAADVARPLLRKFDDQEDTGVKDHLPTVHIENLA